MTPPPRISIVVIGEGDDLAQVPTADSRLRVEIIREPDEGDFATTLNRGFARASGDIMGALTADEALLPGVLERVATEIRPQEGRHVVLGRAAFLLEDISDIAVPRPSQYPGRVEYLAVWAQGFDIVARSSLFWHRSVLERAGAFAGSEPYAVDYDFVCRLTAAHPIHHVAELWSTARFQPPAESEAEMLAVLVSVSRRHWGPWFSPTRWRCEASYLRWKTQAHERARHHARRAESAQLRGRTLEAYVEHAKTWLWSPHMARGRFGRRWRP